MSENKKQILRELGEAVKKVGWAITGASSTINSSEGLLFVAQDAESAIEHLEIAVERMRLEKDGVGLVALD